MADKEKEVCGRKPRRLEELNLLDNFLFQEMVSGEEDRAEFCRMRYYHGLIDTKLLASGTRYDRLPNVVIIVILPHDPFGQNRMVYTIENHCVEDASVCYDDGVKKIFLYTKGTEGNPGRELQDMLKYMEESTEENVTNPDIEKVHRFVQKIKHKAEIGVNYMKSWEWDEMIRKEATREGLEQEG